MINRFGRGAARILSVPRSVRPCLGVGIWHTRASSDAIGDKLAAARLNIELSKLAREKTEADAVAQKAKAELRRA